MPVATNMRAEDEAQLTLDFPIKTRLGPDDFLPAPANEAALALIRRWPADWPKRQPCCPLLLG